MRTVLPAGPGFYTALPYGTTQPDTEWNLIFATVLLSLLHLSLTSDEFGHVSD